MNLIIAATYLVLSGLAVFLLVLLLLNKEKKCMEINDAILGPEELEKHAGEIARHHEVKKKPGRSHWLIPRMNENYKFIFEAYRSLNNDVKEMFATAPAAEWLLDNFYIIGEQVRDIARSLSKGYYSELPVLKSGYLRGYPRVYAIALELVAHTDGRIDENVLMNFIKPYQSYALLSIGELWAIAIMVRIALIENIRHICGEIIESQRRWHKAEELAELLADSTGKKDDELPEIIKERLRGDDILNPSLIEHLLQKLRKQGSRVASAIHYIDMKLAEQNSSIDAVTGLEHQLQAARQVSIGNSITSLKLVSTMDWADIFESLSHVEQILRHDPGSIYTRMDFESRDYYRHVVEKLAGIFNTTETQVARNAIKCAMEAASGSDIETPPNHVGYYLIGKGRKKLEEMTGYKPGVYRSAADAVRTHPASLYLGSITILTSFITACFIYYAGRNAGPLNVIMAVLAGAVVAIPASDLAIAMVNCAVSHIYRPSILPKLELKKGIAGDLSAMVVIPTLLPNEKRVKELLENLEIYYLANREKNLYFALVGDHKDAALRVMPEDEKIVNTALKGIRELNERYASAEQDIFYFFHRHRQYNERQDKWMGWERKRGAIIEFNDLLRGSGDTSFSVTSGNLSRIPYIKYVITLDADTNLPMGAARKLIGTLSHPLNRAVIDRKTGVVADGYGLLQPRISVSILSANSTLFSRIFAGQGGMDPYTTAVSDVYQDLFGEGIFTGKGIYDVDVFQAILKNAIPDNTVLSHDLLEGSYIRAGLVTDIELVDGYPSRYNSFVMRLHRWVRGDWQLLPWLAPRIRDRMGDRVRNPLSVISRWKIIDNMRRSLLNPALLVLIALGFSILPGHRLVWISLAAVTIASPVLISVISAVLSGNYHILKESGNSTIISGLKAAVYQAVLLFTFIPYQAYMMVDAILRTLVRILFTKNHLLEWITAADMETFLKNDLKSFWKRMWISALAGIFVFVLSALFSPNMAPLGLVTLFFWAAAPFTAYSISRTYSKKVKPLSQEDLMELRRLARKTWRYFEDFAVPRDNYLPPDNYQEDPPRGLAHRTSPTNIGLLMMSIMSACDLGYISSLEMVKRLDNVIKTIEKMEKWRGHLYNWYDTITLKVLRPLYVSTVDSGNFTGYLMVLEQGLKEYLKKPLVSINMALGIKDALNLSKEGSSCMSAAVDTVTLDQFITEGDIDLRKWKEVLDNLLGDLAKQDQDKLIKLPWGNKLLLLITSFRNEISALMPFIIFSCNPDATGNDDGHGWLHTGVHKGACCEKVMELADEMVCKCSSNTSLSTLAGIYRETLQDMDKDIAESGCIGTGEASEEFQGMEQEDIKCIRGFKKEITDAQNQVENIINLYENVIKRIQLLVKGVEFFPLFDPKRLLFSIGYNIEEGHLSKSYYDLLASEARQASYIAIARGEVDQRHWFRLGRALAASDRFKGLVSWSGTMFEYLMPLLIMRNYENTLLDETYSFVIRSQKKYGRQRHIPWGVSESGYNAFDINLNYQYRAFGVPELGLKRGLGNDAVIAPYAAVLALSVDPEGVVQNIRELERKGLDGAYGLYEAVDYTPSRLRKGNKNSIVKSFMAHHQGMSIIALNNYINDNIMQQRFHTDPKVKSAELLLQERIPAAAAFTKEHNEEFVLPRKLEQEEGEVIRTFGIPDSPLPHVHILSNGSYSVMITNGGSGYGKYQGMAVTRWKETIKGSSAGFLIYIQNINSNTAWSAAFEPYNIIPEKYRVVFSPDKAEFMRKDGNIETHTEITVSPEDNTEVRRISLTNRSRYSRVLEVTSYFEAVLSPAEVDMAHPAFSNLFVMTEFVPGHECLLASRRPRAEGQAAQWAVHAVAVEGEVIGEIQYETDRSKFIGRNRDLSDPIAMEADRPLTNTSGVVLDPVMSLRRRVRIEPGETIRLSFAVGVAETRKSALELAEKYRDPRASYRAFELAWTRSQIESRYLGFSAGEVEQYLDMIPSILFPGPLRRKWADAVLTNRKGQRDLWSFGISGDIPVALISIGSRDEIDIVYLGLNAHEYWRIKGLSVDLVILAEEESGYAQPLRDMVRDAVSASHARDMQEKPGGVFIWNSKLMSEEDRMLLYAAARIVLRGDAGPVWEQLKWEGKKEKPLPRFITRENPWQKYREGTKAVYPARTAAPAGLEFFNGIGGFGSDGREYVIYLREGQNTPVPWINVISNRRFGFQVSETGSGYTWSENSRENKLTPWFNDPVTDPTGEVFYIRDENEGDYWSITPAPVRERETYVIRHGYGYSVFEHSSHGIGQELTEFVPLDDQVKVCVVRLKNVSGEQRKLSVIYYIRPVLGVNDRITAQYVVTEVHDKTGIVLATNFFNSDFAGRYAFIDVSERERFYTGDRQEFIGLNGDIGRPEALIRETLSGRLGAGFDPCIAMQVKVDLSIGGEKEVVFLLGQGRSVEEVTLIAGKYRDITEVRKEFKRVGEFWEEKLNMFQVYTPDPSMDILLNGWLLYQTISCRLWARSAFYQSGGAYGFRDQLQDAMAVVSVWPEFTRSQILLHSSRQFLEGDVQHWWHPDTGKGIHTRYSDDLLWLVYVTMDYINHTGDENILDEETAYLEDEPLGEYENERYNIPCISGQKSSLYEHCIRAVERALKFGEHGIPLMGSGDWNDSMNTVGSKGRGESVWLGWFLCDILSNFAPVCQARKDEKRAERYKAAAGKIVESIERNAWDGSWYCRAFFDDYTPLGSARNTECRIDSIAQSWSVISGAGRPHRAEEAMDAVEKYLVDREEGIIKLLTPPFDEGILQPGYIKGYVPGVRENGGQYTHAAAWVILAFADLGKGDKAWELFHLINPVNHSRTPIEYARYRVEPYVAAADVYTVHPHTGRGGWTWYTGAAGWMYRVGMEHILGIRKNGGEILFDPCIPQTWSEYKVKYRFKRTIYIIHVSNPGKVNKGVKSVCMDGSLLESGRLNPVDDGLEHLVEVIMG